MTSMNSISQISPISELLENRSLKNNVLKKPAGRFTLFLEKIYKIVKIIFKILLTVFLYWINPSLIAIAFIAGVVFDKKIAKGIKKIQKIWETQPWSVCVLIGAASFCSLPVTLAAASLIWGSHLGTTLYNESKKIAKMTNSENPTVDEKPEKPVVAESG